MRKVGGVKTITSNQAEPAQPLDNPASLAKFLRVTPQCVRNWTREPGFPLVVKSGRIVRFERAAALQFLNGRGAR
jgi:hypothetical protein